MRIAVAFTEFGNLVVAMCSRCLFPILMMALCGPSVQAESLESLFNERQKTSVYLEYFIQRETERQKSEAIGTVLNEEGLVIFLANAFPDWLPPKQFKDIKVFPAGNPNGEGFSGTYLGSDLVNGWTYVRVEKAAREHLKPITRFETAVPSLGDRLWGVCLAASDLDYVAYLRSGFLSLKKKLPLLTGFATSELAAPGAPVFDMKGAFVGWAGNPYPVEHEMWIGSDFFKTSLRVADESPVFLLAEEFHAEAGQEVPENPIGHRRPWVGISGTRPIGEDTAAFLGLEKQGALVVSEVIPGTPAEAAGMEDRDLIVGIDGQPLPRMKPDATLQTYFERKILSREIGDPIRFDLIRGNEPLEVEVVLGEGPKPLREADRQYFEEIGITFREFLIGDAIQRRVDPDEQRGVVTGFVRPNSPAATAGFQPGDWVLELEGEAIPDLASVVSAMENLAGSRDELVFLTKRGSETRVLRVKRD